MPSHSASPAPRPGRDLPTPPAFVLDRAAARAVDRIAVERYGMRPIVLMENASRQVAEEVLETVGGAAGARVLIVCGPGNNGGDGYAAARHLHNSGARVAALASRDPALLRGDAAENYEIARRMGLVARWSDGPAAAVSGLGGLDVIVDAMFGTGLERPLHEAEASLVAWINARRAEGAMVVAVDVPSGLDCDTGRALGSAVTADVTVTFCGPKRGFLQLAAQEYVGELVIADIGVPREIIEEVGTPSLVGGHGRAEADSDEPREPTPKPGDSAR